MGHAEMVTFLLTSGESIDLINSEGMTALHCAVFNDKLRAAQVLLDFDANAALGDRNRVTPLMTATKFNSILLELLMKAAPQSVRDIANDGSTALSIAAENGSVFAVKRFLDCGLPADFNGGNGRTPLMLAASRGHVEILKLLLDKGAPVDEMAHDGNTALTIAAERGQVKVVRALLGKGASVNKHGAEAAPLVAAAQRGHVEVMELLMNKGADVNAHDEDGDTALHEAVYNNHKDAVRLLVESTPSAGVNRRNCSGWTPLMAAAQRDHIGIVDFLLNKTASLTCKTEDGRTALHIAAEEGCAEVVHLLIMHGAKVDALDEDDCTPLMRLHTEDTRNA